MASDTSPTTPVQQLGTREAHLLRGLGRLRARHRSGCKSRNEMLQVIEELILGSIILSETSVYFGSFV